MGRVGLKNFGEVRRKMIAAHPEAVGRMNGRSTAIALSIISQAISHPYETIPVHDHYPSQQAHRFLADHIMDIVNCLGLEGFAICRSPVSTYALIFNLPS